MEPGVREHDIAQRAVAGGDAVVRDHASALQAAAREDIAATSDPEDVLCSICRLIIDLNDRSSVMRTQCNHTFHHIQYVALLPFCRPVTLPFCHVRPAIRSTTSWC